VARILPRGCQDAERWRNRRGAEGGASALTQMLGREVGMALSDKYCGFDEVRRSDEKGYYCECCGKRMDANFREVVRLTLPHKFVEQLDRQCMPNVKVRRGPTEGETK